MSYIKKSSSIIIAVAILILLYYSSLYNYLLFHMFAEVFSICIAITVFIITWNSASVLKNNYLLMIGFAYLFIGCLDLFHTAAYEGMTIFLDSSYHANQLWIAARYFESIILLFSFILIKSTKKVNIYLLFTVYTIFTTLILLSVFVWHNFPIAFIDGVGQTQFKIISEYIIITILLATIFVLHKNKDSFESKVYKFLLLSILLTIASEACFTTYINNYGLTNLFGHYFKIFSFFFIYKAIVQTGIREPYDLIFREIKQTELLLFEQNSSLSHQTIADGLTIKEHLGLLNQQYKILNRQSRLLNLSHEAIFAWDLNGTIFYWNKGAELMYGYLAEEAIGQLNDVLLQTTRPIGMEETLYLLENNEKWIGEIIHTTKDGRLLCIETAKQMYIDEDGNKIVLELCRDITQRNKMEAEIRYQNKLQYAIIENMHDALLVYDCDGNITSVNVQARSMFPDHITSQTSVHSIFEGYRCLDLERNVKSFDDFPTRRAFRGESVRNERIIIERGKWSRIVEVTAIPIFDDQNKLMALVVSYHDITELMKTQHAIEDHIVQLQQQNKILNRQAKLLDLSNEAIFAYYMDGPIIYWNQGAENIYGYKDDAAVGCLPYKLLNSRYPIDFKELSSLLLEHGSWKGLVDHTTKDGRLLCIESRQQIIINELGLNTVLETNRDVTEMIKAENEIKKGTMELINIINSTDDFIWSVDPDYKIILWNKSVNDFISGFYGMEIKSGLSLEEAFPEETFSIFIELLDRVKTEGELHVDIRISRDNRVFSYSFHPVYIDSQLIEITMFGRDITERINAEQEIIKLNTSLETRVNERTEELHQSIKTLQNFSLTVTHDLKMPLQEINKYSKQIQENIDIATNSAKIIDLCAGMNKMISELLEYERLTGIELRKETIDLKKMIIDVYEKQKYVNSVLDFQTGIPKIFADKTLIHHVITNLISNALKFSTNREISKIIVGCSRENNEYVISIKDNGIGIDMEYAGKLFSAFERLHNTDEYEGQGIGLAAVRNIIAKHNGRTWISGRPNAGTTVYFTIPVASDEVN